MKELEEINSICPECLKQGKIEKIDAKIIEENGNVWITKKCNKHGFLKDIYFRDSNLYKRWMKYKVTGNFNPDVKTSLFGDQPLYDKHLSQSVLTNLLVTNRCNIRCSYCFMNAGASGNVYEPTLDQLRDIMKKARSEESIGSKAIQITGGEPTIREDLFDIIKIAKELGFSHVQVNSNGLKLAESVDYCQKLKDAKINTVYMSFDGVTKKNNPWIEENKQTIKNCREVGLKIILVPVLIGDKNVDEAGKIIRFGIENIDTVRGVNFQPLSFCGRITRIEEEKRKHQRVDYSKVMEVIEEEFNGQISRDDFYPVPFVLPISVLIGQLKRETQVEFTAHPGCGGATYVFLNNGMPLPITRFINVEKMIDFVSEQIKKKGLLKKTRVVSAFLTNINKFVDKDKAPQGFNLRKILKNAVFGGSYDSLRGFHHKSMFIGIMWFQDAWNLNIDRLQRCVIHYATFEGMIPFCTYNGLGYGDKIREKYSIPIKEWEEKTGKKTFFPFFYFRKLLIILFACL